MLILYLLIKYVLTNNIISDPVYTLPECINNTPNQYASIVLNTDIIRENISIVIDFLNLPIYSCYLCDKIGGNRYCNNTINPNDIGLSKDLSFNVMSIAVKETDEFPVNIDNNFMITTNNKISIPLSKLTLQKEIDCNQDIKMIIVVFIILKYPVQRNIITIANNERDYPTQKMKCNQSDKIFRLLDCSVIGEHYYYITYKTPSCISNRKEIQKNNTYDNTSYNIYTSLYWYKEALNGVYHIDVTDRNENIICGKDWLTILKNSNMTMYCGDNSYLYVKMKPWYKLAIQVITTKLNIKYAISDENDRFEINKLIGMDLMLAYDTLDRTCKEKDTIEINIENTFYNEVYKKLSLFNGEYDGKNNDTINICNDIMFILNKTGSELDTGFIPRYVYFFNSWYFYYFQYLFLYTTDIETASIVFIIFMSLSCTFYVIMLFIVPIWLYIANYCKKRRDLAKLNDYVMI